MASLPKTALSGPRTNLHLLDVAERQQRKIEPAAERVHAHAVHEHERVVRLAAAREDRCQRPAAAAPAHRKSGNRAEGVRHGLELPALDVGRGHDRRRGRGLRERAGHLGGRHDHGFRHRRHVQRDHERPSRVPWHAYGHRVALEAGRQDPHPVRGGRRGRHGERAVSVRAHRACAQWAVQHHQGAGHGAAIGIDHAAACGRVGAGGQRGRQQQHEKQSEENVGRVRAAGGNVGPQVGASHVHSFRRESAPAPPEDTPGEGSDGLTTRSPDLRIVACARAFPCPEAQWRTARRVGWPRRIGVLRGGIRLGCGRRGARSPLTVAVPCGLFTQLRSVAQASVGCAAEYSMAGYGGPAGPGRRSRAGRRVPESRRGRVASPSGHGLT